jgi:hypothetical protein
MHTIKLRGPWQVEALESTTGELPPPTETTVPGDWGSALGNDFRGRARYTRGFGLPTNLDPSEWVSLMVGLVDYSASIQLNGELLGEQTWGDGERRYDITSLLKPRNELQIVVTLLEDLPRPGREDQPGGLLGEVRLEIES